MMDMSQVGRILLVVGVCIAIVGGLLMFLGRSGFLSSLFSSGTIHVGGNGFSCLIPIATSVFLSIVLTVVLNIVIRFLNK